MGLKRGTKWRQCRSHDGDTGRVRAGSTLRRLIAGPVGWRHGLRQRRAYLDGQGGEAADGGRESASPLPMAAPASIPAISSARRLAPAAGYAPRPPGPSDRAETAIKPSINPDGFLMRPSAGPQSTSDAAAADTEGEGR